MSTRIITCKKCKHTMQAIGRFARYSRTYRDSCPRCTKAFSDEDMKRILNEFKTKG